MYLDALVKIPEVKGKITYRKKGKTTYVEYEYGREYDRVRRFTIELGDKVVKHRSNSLGY